MKIKSDLRAGMNFTQCDQLRNIYKDAAKTGKCEVLTQYPVSYQQSTSGSSSTSGSTTTTASSAYPDYSGYCG